MVNNNTPENKDKPTFYSPDNIFVFRDPSNPNSSLPISSSDDHRFEEFFQDLISPNWMSQGMENISNQLNLSSQTIQTNFSSLNMHNFDILYNSFENQNSNNNFIHQQGDHSLWNSGRERMTTFNNNQTFLNTQNPSLNLDSIFTTPIQSNNNVLNNSLRETQSTSSYLTSFNPLNLNFFNNRSAQNEISVPLQNEITSRNVITSAQSIQFTSPQIYSNVSHYAPQLIEVRFNENRDNWTPFINQNIFNPCSLSNPAPVPVLIQNRNININSRSAVNGSIQMTPINPNNVQQMMTINMQPYFVVHQPQHGQQLPFQNYPLNQHPNLIVTNGMQGNTIFQNSNEPVDLMKNPNNWQRLPNNKGFRCNICERCYTRKYGLKIHLRIHSEFKPLECNVCKKKFGDPSNMAKHKRLHSSEASPYKCIICNKSLVRRRDLERHMKSRHSDFKGNYENSNTSKKN